uniref:Tektin n=1 Tax=Echinostoma caproni TaxID=27848 RepID=A0A183BED2_9TREM
LDRLRADRDSLLSLLDKFERQLVEIQSNVRVLTEERNLLNDQLNQVINSPRFAENVTERAHWLSNLQCIPTVLLTR